MQALKLTQCGNVTWLTHEKARVQTMKSDAKSHSLNPTFIIINALGHEGGSEEQVSRLHANVGRQPRARILPSTGRHQRVEMGGGGRHSSKGHG